MADNTTLPGNGDVIASDDIGGVKYQRVKPAWGSDGTAIDVDATNPLPTSTNASIFRFSTNNSSTVQLAANATFSGVIETGLDQPSISLLMTSDQPMTVTIYQYIDLAGTYAVTPIVYNVTANQGLSASLALNGNYVKVTAKNVGTAATTTFNLNTAYGNLPSSDGSGRLPVTNADCIQLLSTTITGTGVSSSMDTAGFSAVVTQLSGVWQGNLTFEGSNDGVTWDGLMVHSRDNPALQDIVNQGGLYTVRPAGRYMRLNVTNITGSMSVNAIGRSGTGIDAGDYLSLAMDKNNNAPLNVSLDDDSVRRMGAAPSGWTQIATYNYGQAVVPINTLVGVWDVSAYKTLSLQAAVGTTGVLTMQCSNDGITWFSQSWINSAGFGLGTTMQTGFVTTQVVAKYLRVFVSVATTAGGLYLVLSGSSTATPTAAGGVTATVTGYPTAAASADALANPTITQIGADQMQFNGTSWDRVRNNWNVNTGDTGAKTASFAGATQTNYNAAGATIAINMGAVTGTTPTLTAQVQGSADGGTTWYNIPGAVTASITTGSTVTVLTVYPGVTVAANAAISHPLPRTWRLNYTIGGTTPSFTITNVQVAYIL